MSDDVGVAEDLIELERARELIAGHVVRLNHEGVELREALGRVLAAEVVASTPIAPFDNSAMDGYAVRAADTAEAGESGSVCLDVIGESRAGTPFEGPLEGGQAVVISTGAMLPEGADAVVPVEETSGTTVGEVRIDVAVSEGEHVRRAGDDIAAGETALEAGELLAPAELGICASVGVPRPRCALRPRLAILGTGDELADPDEELEPGQIHDANSYTIDALARLAGAAVQWVDTVGDERELTRIALRRSLEHNVAIVCGGVSVGRHDHVREVLDELEVEEVFWGLALKPGKPTYFGVHRGARPKDGGTLVFGLPGNPVSAMVTFMLLVRPTLIAMQGADPGGHAGTAVLTEDYAKAPGRCHAVRCSLERAGGELRATPTGPQGSHLLGSMLNADALALIPTECGDLEAGAEVEIELLRHGTWTGD